ncbi:hypothetical protein F5Y18DRAFT_425266 [Xylariaceae sp. FL1019]|nr:hypothetical protein F5Y18DRAFT_425266 [Xylariaceae sp. FL1019]
MGSLPDLPAFDESDDEVVTSMGGRALAQRLSSSALPLPYGDTTAVTDLEDTTSESSDLSTINAYEPLALNIGDVPEVTATFAPFKLIKRYPHMYVGRTNQKKAYDYFKETLLKDCIWDIFVQHDPAPTRSPLLLVPTCQFEQYLETFNKKFQKQLCIPEGNAKDGFYLTFGESDTPRPRYLGRVENAEAFDNLKPLILTMSGADLSGLSPDCLQTYKDKMNKIYASLKGDPDKLARKAERQTLKKAQMYKSWSRMVKRVQQYFGLRQPRLEQFSTQDPALEWNVNLPPKFKPRDSVRFVCIDVEAYERNNDIVTEFGFAILDTKDIEDVAPGKRGEDWFPMIEAHHIRIEEYSYMRNTEYVKGCPESFNFGKSAMVSINNINRVIGQLLGDPQSKDKRPVVLLGHDLPQDIRYLDKVGYNPHGDSCLVMDEIDTKSMFQRLQRSPNGRSLDTVCSELGIPGYNYHNAGNDAVYTLRAMISMAIKRTVEGSDKKEDVAGGDEWTDGELVDGGEASRSAPIVQQEVAAQPNAQQPEAQQPKAQETKAQPEDVQW